MPRANSRSVRGLHLKLATFSLAFLAGISAAAAQSSYPSRPVRLLVASAAGGGTDIVARVLANELSQSGAQFFIENRGGAGGIVGIEAARHADPDGSTVLVSPGSITILPAVNKQARYNALEDFIPVTQIAGTANVLVVHPAVPAATLAELITVAKARPGELIYASAGAGSSPHMNMELLKQMAGIDLRHAPFRGTGPAMTEVLSGRIAAIFSNLLTANPLIEAGQLRALALSGPKRLDDLPGIPPVAEVVPGYSALQWYGLFVPAATPKPVVDKLYAMVQSALATPAVRERLARDSAEAIGNSPAEFTEVVRRELKTWAAIARAANIQAE